MLRVGRNREKNTRLPRGWDVKPSGIYFRPTNATDKDIVRRLTGGPLSLRLGATEDEAHRGEPWKRILAARAVPETTEGTVGELVDRAQRFYLPRIQNAETRAWRVRWLLEIGKVWGSRRYAKNVYDATKAAPGTFLVAMEVQRYVDDNAHRPAAVNDVVNAGRILFSDARRRWGRTEYNPFEGIELHPEVPRNVLPEDPQIAKVYRKLDPPMRFMVQMIRFYGRRRGELLKLTIASARDDGLHLVRGKSRNGRVKVIVIRWDGKLRRLWARLMAWRTNVRRGGNLETTAAILNRDGMPYTKTGFNSAWRRGRKRAGLHGAFTFHDIRATHAQTFETVQEAQHSLAHDEQATTAGTYRRGPHIIDFTKDSRNSRKRGT